MVFKLQLFLDIVVKRIFLTEHHMCFVFGETG